MKSRSDSLMTIARRFKKAMACGVAVALAMPALPGRAAQTSAPLGVTVNLQTGNAVPNTGLCTVIGAFATRVTVSCADASLRFLLSPRVDMRQDAETGYAGLGVATSWRMISFGSREYIEMTVRW